MDKIYVVLLNLRSHPMHSARCPTRDIVISWIHIAWTNLEVSQLRQCRVSAPQLGESIQEGLPLFHGIKWAEIQPIFPPLICWPATFIQCAVCTGFIRLDWVCLSHYFSWLQSQVSSEFAADWNLVNGCDWWGQNIAQNSTQSYIVSSALQRYLSPLLCSSQPITLLLSSQQITEYDQFCTMDAVQKSENETESSGKEMQNIKTGKSRRKTGEGRVDKQGVHEWTNRVCN